MRLPLGQSGDGSNAVIVISIVPMVPIATLGAFQIIDYRHELIMVTFQSSVLRVQSGAMALQLRVGRCESIQLQLWEIALKKVHNNLRVEQAMLSEMI